MPKLVIQALDKEWSVELKEGSNVVGRSTKCTIPVQDQNISREHCEIVLTGGVATLFDKGSMNGTILNGKRIWEEKLTAGDQVRIVNVVLWFEKKGISHPAPAVKKEKKASPDEKSGKDREDVQTRRVEGTKRSEVRRSVAALVPDYAAWGSPGINWLAILGGLGGLAALIVVAVIGVRILGGKKGPAIDRDNLLRSNAGFESSPAGSLPGWKLSPPANSELGVTASASRNGEHALVLTKSRAPGQSIVSATSSSKFTASADSYHLTAWAKWGTFTGRAALKITWVRNDGILFETCSEPVEKSTEWVELSGTFSRPAEAQAFRVGVTTIGRGGRIYFDDFRLVAREQPSHAKPVSLGSWSVQVSERGNISIRTRGKVLLNNVHLRLENERDGASSQLFLPAEVMKEGNSLRVSGEMPHPVLVEKTVPFDLSLEPRSGQLWAVYEFDHADLRQVDRIVVEIIFPRTITGGATQGSARFFEFSLRDEEYALRYPEHLMALRRTENGLRQVFSVEGGENGRTRVGFAVLSIGKEDPLTKARAKEKDDPGAALEILRGARRRMVLSRQDEDRVTAMVNRLLKMESREWDTVEASVHMAEALGLATLLEEAKARLSSWRRRWSGGEFDGKSSDCEAALDQVKVMDGGASERAISLARQYFEAGSSALAEEILLALLTRSPDADVAEEARDLLQTLQSSE